VATAAFCASCHKAEAASAPAGHAPCEGCHATHDPTAKPVSCATCHTDKPKTEHGRVVADCTTCHRAHGPNGAPSPPACASCHAQPPGLHAVAQHAACSACHSAHETRPSSDRATCLACHRDRNNHEPAAKTCAGCHPFRRSR
jgi:hypothetical protein